MRAPLLVLGLVTAGGVQPVAADEISTGAPDEEALGLVDECTPPRVMVLFDKSSSMVNRTINGRTPWSIAVEALGTVLTEMQSKTEIGVMVFPHGKRCSAGKLDVAPGLDTRAKILSALGSPPQTEGYYTPMFETLAAAAGEPMLVDGDGPRYVVLITDGFQWCGTGKEGTDAGAVAAVARLTAAGVKTYVVGFGGGVRARAMNLMAKEGLTARPGCNVDNKKPTDPNQCYYQADSADELLAALDEISIEVMDEVCDGRDNDCDRHVDEDLTRECSTSCGTGRETCMAGEWTGCNLPPPTEERCDGRDNDCDGATDERRNVGDDAGGSLCGPGKLCRGGMCVPRAPAPPDKDEEPAASDGDAAGGCCDAGRSAGAGSLLLAGVVALLLGRRRFRLRRLRHA